MTLLLTSLLSSSLFLGGCSNFRFPGVYRIDITQGNFTTQEQLDQLEPGMSPEQVRYIMGHPTLIDPFTPNVWFYPMTFLPGDSQEEVRQDITVYFENGVYSHFEGQLLDDFKNKTSGHKDRALQEKAIRKLREAEEKKL